MSFEIAISKYMDAINSKVFVRYEKEFANRIIFSLSKGYQQNLHEPQIVKNLVNHIKDLKMTDSKINFELSTRSIFIHGNKSQAEFDYYGEIIHRELGDVIFIISVVLNGQKYFEKFTINQLKKDSMISKNVFWDISNKEQLYLLSRFPIFRGIKGSIIPMKDYTLPNFSGSLGSYGLLYIPGDFSFVSAIDLDCLIDQRNTLKMNELYYLSHKMEKSSFSYFPYFYPDMNEILYLMNKFYKYYGSKWYFLWNLFGNYHYAYNAFDFAYKYLSLGIGEPIFMRIGIDNFHARAFLHELLSAAKIKATRESDGEVLKFMDSFFRYGYAGNEGEGGFKEGMEFDFEGGGIGIIHTILNLGE